MFDFHLNENSVVGELTPSTISGLVTGEDIDVSVPNITAHESQSFELDQCSEPSKISKINMPATTIDKEKSSQRSSKEAHCRSQTNSTRSCTKVHKQGSALGREVDLTKFEGYTKLIHEL